MISIRNNKEDPKFKVGDHVSISKYKNIFAKGYAPNWSEKAFAITKVQNAVSRTHVISNVKGKEIVGMSYEKEMQKTNQKEFRIENVIKKKVINYIPNRKVMIIPLIVGLLKKMLYKSELFSTL